ncbi:hypothetical protein GJV44_00912 [Candidatus Vallotia cooleyia]|nr:hypothetical protein GJV44_00912 [Candidatus Vallotia cooleyia]
MNTLGQDCNRLLSIYSSYKLVFSNMLVSIAASQGLAAKDTTITFVVSTEINIYPRNNVDSNVKSRQK